MTLHFAIVSTLLQLKIFLNIPHAPPREVRRNIYNNIENPCRKEKKYFLKKEREERRAWIFSDPVQPQGAAREPDDGESFVKGLFTKKGF